MFDIQTKKDYGDRYMINQKHSKGFTLVELLVTISVLAILATVSVVGYVSFIEKTYLSKDQYLIAQLNNYKDAFMVGNGSELNSETVDEIVNNFLDDAGETDLTLSTGDKNTVVFNTETNKFEIVSQDFIPNNNYLEINKQPSDITHPSDNNQEDNSSDEDNIPSTQEPDLVCQNFGDSSSSSTKQRYIYMKDGVLYVGIIIDYDSNMKPNSTKLLLSDISINDNNNPTATYSVSKIIINDEEYMDSFTFTEVGYSLMQIVVIDENSKEYALDVPVICKNAKYDDATIDHSKVEITTIYSDNNNGTYTYKLTFSNPRNTIITDYNTEWDQVYSNYLSEWSREYNDRFSLFVNINGQEYQILNSKFEETFNIPPEDLECIVIYRYQGLNGIIVESRVEVDITQN